MAPQSLVGQGLLIIDVSPSQTHQTRYDSSGREISPKQRPLLDNTQHSQTSMPQAGFEPTIPASEWPQTHTLDRAATGIGKAVGFTVRNAQCDVRNHSAA